MRWSKRSEYGLRAAVQLAASFDAGFLQTREICRREKLPNKFLESILRSMKDAGLLASKVGAAGGYRLADRPDNIPVGRVLRVLEGQLASPDLLEAPSDPAAASRGVMALHLLASRAEDAIASAIDSVSLSELLEEATRAKGDVKQMYYI